MRADIDIGRHHRATGGVEAEAGEPTVGVALEPATGGIGDVVTDAGRRQDRRVHQHVVPGGMEEEDGWPPAACVELVSARERVLAVVDAEAADRHAGRRRPGGVRTTSSRACGESTVGNRRSSEASDSPVARQWLCASTNPGRREPPSRSTRAARGHSSAMSTSAPTPTIVDPRTAIASAHGSCRRAVKIDPLEKTRARSGPSAHIPRSVRAVQQRTEGSIVRWTESIPASARWSPPPDPGS